MAQAFLKKHYGYLLFTDATQKLIVQSLLSINKSLKLNGLKQLSGLRVVNRDWRVINLSTFFCKSV